MARPALMAIVIVSLCVTTSHAGDSARKPGLLGWLATKRDKPLEEESAPRSSDRNSMVRHAVVEDAEVEAPYVVQTSKKPELEEPKRLAPVTTVNTVDPTPASAPTSPRLPMPQTRPKRIVIQNAPSTPAMSVTHYPGASPSGRPIYPAGYRTAQPLPVYPATAHRSMGAEYQGNGAQANGPYSVGHYPQNAAALYPCPLPNIPKQVGGSMITNQAFYPHEMLYAHEYKAVYPPYYHKVRGGWMLTPWGMWSHENWKLQGTEVSVKYKSHISPFANFWPPTSN